MHQNEKLYRGRGQVSGVHIDDANRPKGPVQGAKDFLRDCLWDGPMTIEEVKAMAETSGIAPMHLGRAVEILKIVVDEEAQTYALPETEKPAEVAETRPPAVDEFSLTAEECKEYGIDLNTHEYGWIRDERVWGHGPDGEYNRARQYMLHNRGGEVVLVGGEPVPNGSDLILVKRPKSEVEKMRQREREQEKHHWGQNEKAQQGALRDDDFHKSNEAYMRQLKEQRRQESIQMGLVGGTSLSQGMTMEEFIDARRLTAEQVEAERRHHALGRMAVQDVDDVGEAARLLRDQRQQQRGSGGKVYSIPPTVRPRNLAKR